MWTKHIRDLATFALGATGFLHELLLTSGERPFLLTASLALMGLPLVLKAEEKVKDRLDQERKE